MRTPSAVRRPRDAFDLVLLVLLALAGGALAREGQETKPQAPPPAPSRQERPALSAEDAALVQHLALVEHVELLRHLELFEKEPAAPPKKRQ